MKELQNTYVGVRGAVIGRGTVIGALYFRSPYFDNHQFFCLVLEQQYASSRTKQKNWWFSKYGPPQYRVPITASLSKTASFTPKYVFLHNYSEFFFNMIFIKHSADALYKKKIFFSIIR